MNRLFASFFVLYIILCGGPFLYAQVDKPYYVDNSHTVYVPKRTIIYPLSEYSTEKVLRERYADEWSSDYVNTYLLSKKVRVSADINIPVIGFTKSGMGIQKYDYYIVDYDGQLCYLPKDSCPDNTVIDSKNNEIAAYYQSMKQQLTDWSEDFLTRVTLKAQEATNELAYIKERKNYIVDSVSTARIQQRKAEMLNEYYLWKDQLNEVGERVSKIIVIHNSELSLPNSAAGCDYSLSYTNTSSKIIKYLDWTGNAFNAVNDIVSCETRHLSVLQGRETGPISPNNEGGGLWENIIYNWSAKELRLSGISIIYTDGTKTNLTGKEIMAVMGAPHFSLSYVEESMINIQAKSEIEVRIHNLEEVSKYLNYPEGASYLAPDILKEEEELYKRINELGIQCSFYRNRNSIPRWDDAPESVRRLIVIY